MKNLKEYSYDLGKRFDYFNSLFFDRELAKIDVYFEKKSGNAVGSYFPSKKEIVIYAEDKSDKYIDSVLIHEMIHLWTDEMGYNSRQHHDKAFKSKVDEINRLSNNEYRVGYTHISSSIDVEDEEENVYFMFMLASSSFSLAKRNLVYPIQILSEDKFSFSMAEDMLENTKHHGSMNPNIKYILIAKVVINNNFISFSDIEKRLDTFEMGFLGPTTTKDEYLFKMMKQSKQYEIVAKYDWSKGKFISSNKERIRMKNKIYLKEGLQLYDENGNLYEIEEGDYVVIDDELYNGPILNIDLINQIEDKEKKAIILDYIEKYGEHYIIDQLLKGIEVEHEHSENDSIALKIAVDHLVEFYDYYDRLIAMETEAKKEIGE